MDTQPTEQQVSVQPTPPGLPAFRELFKESWQLFRSRFHTSFFVIVPLAIGAILIGFAGKIGFFGAILALIVGICLIVLYFLAPIALIFVAADDTRPLQA